MRFAEIFLRLGASLVGWMIIIAYLLWTAVSTKLDCAVSGDELYRLLLYTGPPAALLSIMIRATSPMHDVHSILRWLCVVPALLLPFALIALYAVGTSLYLRAEPLCSDGPLPAWQHAFVPVVMLSLAAIIWSCTRVWRTPDRL